jgi:hypothetical protein
MKQATYTIREKVWLYPSETTAWHFVSVPKTIAQEIKTHFGSMAKGFGSLPVSVTIGTSTWRTSIFPDKRTSSYLLPLKKSIRVKEGIYDKDTITYTLTLLS